MQSTVQALPESLLESELFGHVKGSFTGAHDERKGLFCEAEGGTLFFDEVADIPLSLQPKLLRAIEQRCVRPVGGNNEILFDVRILSATNRDLESAVDAGTFRDDLFYRLNVINVHIPPLRCPGNGLSAYCQVLYLRHSEKTRKKGQRDDRVNGQKDIGL